MTRLRLTIALLAIAMTTSCSIRRGATPASLLLVSLEIPTPEELGCFGDPDARTPLWDRLSRRGATFRMNTGGNEDLVRTLLTGDQTGPSLAEALAKDGIVSATFTEPGLSRDSDLRRGFDTVESWNSVELVTVSPVLRLLPRALAWVRSLAANARYFLHVGVRDPDASTERIDRALDLWLRDLGEERRLERAMIVFLGRRTPGRDDSPVPLVLFGPMPFRGGLVRADEAKPLDVYPTILDAFRHGPDYRLEGRALQKDPASSRRR